MRSKEGNAIAEDLLSNEGGAMTDYDGRNQSSAPLGQATRRSRAEGGWIGMFA